MLGFSPVLALLTNPLADVSAAVAQGRPFDWRTAEGALYCIRCVGEHPDVPQGEPQLAALLDALPGLPRQPPQLQYTASNVVGAYDHWLASSLEAGRVPPSLLPKLLQFATANLEIAEAAGTAAAAIQRLCVRCGRFMAPSLEAVMALCSRALQAGAGSKLTGETPAGLAIVEQDVLLIVEGTCAVMCKALDAEQLAGAAAMLGQSILSALNIALGQLRALQQQQGGAFTRPSYQVPHLLPLADRLATFFRSLSHAAGTAASVLSMSWPTLDALLLAVGDDGEAAEQVSRALRYGIKSSGAACAALLPALLEALPARFRQSRQPAFLYIVSELVKIFSYDSAHEAHLAPILTQLVSEACALLSGRLDALTASPDIVDDLYLLACRALSYSPSLLTTSPALPSLMDTCVLAVLLQHRGACVSALSFLARLFDHDTYAPPGNPAAAQNVQQLTAARGQRIVRVLLADVAGVQTASRVPDVCSALSMLLKFGASAALGWFVEAVSAVPDAAARPADKEALVGAAAALASGPSNITDAKANVRAFSRTVDEFSDICRRNRRAQQAALQALLPPDLSDVAVLYGP